MFFVHISCASSSALWHTQTPQWARTDSPWSVVKQELILSNKTKYAILDLVANILAFQVLCFILHNLVFSSPAQYAPIVRSIAPFFLPTHQPPSVLPASYIQMRFHNPSFQHCFVNTLLSLILLSFNYICLVRVHL